MALVPHLDYDTNDKEEESGKEADDEETKSRENEEHCHVTTIWEELYGKEADGATLIDTGCGRATMGLSWFNSYKEKLSEETRNPAPTLKP